MKDKSACERCEGGFIYVLRGGHRHVYGCDTCGGCPDKTIRVYGLGMGVKVWRAAWVKGDGGKRDGTPDGAVTAEDNLWKL